jgi:cytosine permease
MAENVQQTDFAMSRIPAEFRKNGFSIFVTTAGWIICLSTMFTGGALTAGLKFTDTLLAALIGMIILTLFSAPLAALGGKFGVSTTMLTRHSLGKIGSRIFGTIVALLLGVGWFAWQAAFFGITLAELLPGTLFANPLFGALLGGILMTASAIFGYRGIAILSTAAVPLIVLLSVIGSAVGISRSGGFTALLAMPPAGTPFPLFQGITIVVGNAAMGAVVLSDLTRYAKTAKTGALSASLGYMTGGIFCVAAGAAMAAAVNIPGIGSTPNLPKIMVALGLGAGALLVLVLAQWTTNTANIYSGAVSVGGFLPVRHKILVSIMGAAGTVLALSNIYEYFVPFLNILGTALPPIAGVMLADYYIVHKLILKKEYEFGKNTKYHQFNILAFACIFAGAFLASSIHFFTPAFMSIVYAFVLYSVLACLSRKVKIPYTIGTWVESE